MVRYAVAVTVVLTALLATACAPSPLRRRTPEPGYPRY